MPETQEIKIISLDRLTFYDSLMKTYYAKASDIPTGALASKNIISESDLDNSLIEKVNAASEGNHSHSNKAVLDEITAERVVNWDGTLVSAKTYSDDAAATVKNDLLNGAGEAHNTLKKLGELIDDNKDAIDALGEIVSDKANATHIHAISDVTNLQRALDGKAASDHTHEEYLTSDDIGDKADKNYIDEELAKKADISHTHNNIYYTKDQIDTMEFITVDDIDAICGSSIQIASEVVF